MIIWENIPIVVVNLRHPTDLSLNRSNKNIKLIKLSKLEISTHLENNANMHKNKYYILNYWVVKMIKSSIQINFNKNSRLINNFRG